MHGLCGWHRFFLWACRFGEISLLTPFCITVVLESTPQSSSPSFQAHHPQILLNVPTKASKGVQEFRKQSLSSLNRFQSIMCPGEPAERIRTTFRTISFELTKRSQRNERWNICRIWPHILWNVVLECAFPTTHAHARTHAHTRTLVHLDYYRLLSPSKSNSELNQAYEVYD